MFLDSLLAFLLCWVENLSLAKCLVVISLASTYQNEGIAHKMKLSLPIIEEILEYKDHIETIFKYLPKMRRFITPNELNKIIAITEILKEFMWRLMLQNVKITDEELMLNARLLTKVFSVTGLQIDDEWKQFFRKNFEPSILRNGIEPIKKTTKKDFYVQNILKHVQHRLDSEVVAQFNEHLKKINSNDLILVCSKTVDKQYVDRKQTSKKRSKIKNVNVDEECLKGSGDSEYDKINNPESGKASKPKRSGEKSLQKENSSVTADRIHEFKENTDTTTNVFKEEPQEFFKTEENEMEECICIVDANELTNESQAIRMHEENEFEEYMINDDSNEMIEIYEVIDEDDNDNDMNFEKYSSTVDPENENPECIKKTINLDKKTKTNLSIFNETQYKMNQEFYVKQENENPECVATETEFYNYSQELPLDQIKEELIEVNANEGIRQEDKVCEDPQAMQTLKQHFYVEPEIKQEPDETNENVDKNGNYSGLEEFEEPQTMQYSIQNSSEHLVEPEIKQEPEETNYRDRATQISCVEATESELNQPSEAIVDFDKIERDKDLGMFQDPQRIECLIQRKYILPMEHEMKKESVKKIVNPYQSDASTEYENLDTTPLKYLNVELYDNVQYQENKTDEKRNEIVPSYDILRNNIAAILKNYDHLKEQRALDIAKIFRSKPYGQLCCDTLSLDPIIFTYITILSNEPKILREQALRMSFQIVLGEELYNCQYQYSIKPEDLELYRQFVLLLYSTKHRLFQLKHIMKGIFNESEIKLILSNSYHILEEWRMFFKKHFISMLYRKAVFEMLFEYRTRHNLISSVLDQNDIEALPQTTIKDIQQFFHSDFELGRNWPQRYNAYIRKKGYENPNSNSYREFTTNDLSLNRIYADIKERLPQIVVEMFCCSEEEGDMWNVNNDVSKIYKAVDRLKLKDSNLQVERFENLIIQKDQNDNIYSKPKIIQDSLKKPRDNIIETSITEPPNKKPKIDQFMDTISQKTSKEIQSVEESRDSEISTAIDLLSENASDNNPAEIIEIAYIEKMHNWEKTHLVCTLHNDPIIASYLSNSRLRDGRHFPVFSASILQKAFEQLFKENNIGKYSVCQPKDLHLYRKLLLLYYSSHQKYKNRICEIMICFDTKTIKEYQVNSSNIITEWRTFFNKNISRLLYKQAIYEMLYEYTRRYLKKENVILDEALIQTTAEIQRFLRCNIILPEQWLENFSAMFARRFGFYKYSNKCELFNRIHTNLSTNNSSIFPGNYLDFYSIYKRVKYRLNFLVSDTLSKELESVHTVDTEKSSTSSEINAIDNEMDEANENLIKTTESIDVFIKKQLAEDPIIIKFFQLSKEETPPGTRLPIYSEDLLRLSFKEVLKYCRMRPASCDDFQLYRQLILFKYSEQCASIDELAKSMKCFTVPVIGYHFKNYMNIIQKWHNINENFLAVYIFQKALLEMLFEYARRLLRIDPYVPNYRLIEKFDEMKDFFDLDLKLPTKRYFYNIILKNLLIIEAESRTIKYKNTDLDLDTIYESIKSRLHSFAIEKRDAIAPARKHFKRVVERIVEKKNKNNNLKTIQQCLKKTLTVLNLKSKAHRKLNAQELGENTKVQNEDTEETSAKETNNKATSNMDSFKEIHFHAGHNEEKSLSGDVSDASDIDESTSIGDCNTEEIIEVDSDDDMKVSKHTECIEALRRYLKKQEEKRLERTQPKMHLYHKRKHQKSDDIIIETQKNRILNQTKGILATTSKPHKKLEKSDEIISIISDSESNDEEEIELIIMSDDDT